MSGVGTPERKDKTVAEGQAREGAGRRTQKSDAAFRTISEVAAELDVPQHVLRFWETKFSQIRPMKRGGGRRYYRPEDVVLLTTLRDLLYREGYTIKGVQKLLRESGAKALVHTVQERQERAEAEGGPLGPVGFALSEDSHGEGAAASDETAIDHIDHIDHIDREAHSDEASGDPVHEHPPLAPVVGLSESDRAEISGVLNELVALQGLLRQAIDVARAPTPPPGG